jgi:hypothetical protein
VSIYAVERLRYKEIQRDTTEILMRVDDVGQMDFKGQNLKGSSFRPKQGTLIDEEKSLAVMGAPQY